MKRLLFFLVAIGLASTAWAEPSIIFLVRHAERADAGGSPQSDPAISAIGQARATALAQELRDARITAIYTTEYQRTRQTAAPLARSLGVKTEVVPARDSAALIAKLKAGSGRVLVVGHSNTLPEIIRALGIAAPVALGEKDYDDLFLVVLEEPPRLIHLHYR